MEARLNLSHLSRGHFWCDQEAIQLSSFLDSKVACVFFSALAKVILTVTIAAMAFPYAIPLVPEVLIPRGIGRAVTTLFVDWLSSGMPEEYQELRRVAQAYQAVPRMMEALHAVYHFVRTNPIQLHQSYDYHDFHHELTVITEQVKTRVDLQEIWVPFLNRLEGRTIYQPDGKTTTLHTGMERGRLAGRNIKVITERFDPNSPQSDREFEQMFEIAQECFVGNTTPNRSAWRAKWRCPENQIHMAKSRDTGEVLGYVWAKEEKDRQGHEHLHICSVARKAEACSIGVANHLFQQVFDQSLNRFRSVYLEVRESNQKAIDLYSKWGFQFQKVHANGYYTYPLENGHVMVRSPVVT